MKTPCTAATPRSRAAEFRLPRTRSQRRLRVALFAVSNRQRLQGECHVHGKDGFSSFSVDDFAKAKQFYGKTLGLTAEENAMGSLDVRLPSGHRVMIYPKDNHEPAKFTVLNLVVQDLEPAVDELNGLGVKTRIYDDPDLPTDSKGSARLACPPQASISILTNIPTWG